MIFGNVWKFGDGIDTDIIIPARYLVLPLKEMKHKTMEPIDPEFAAKVKKGDIIVAGKNFGCGSSREQAPAVLKALGISAIVAVSFARIFFRNAINLGIPVIECDKIQDHIQTGNNIEIYPESGDIITPETKRNFSGSTLPDFLMEIVEAGGLIPHLAAKAKSSAT
jgi:3-isopropylmalate/(R)-2-methylmalate dehydratase small subunit